MKKLRFKEILTFICTMSSIISSLVIVFTFLTLYQFKYIGDIFSSYFALQISVCITMFLWSIRFFFYRKGKERITYPAICTIIVFLLIFFMMNRVK